MPEQPQAGSTAAPALHRRLGLPLLTFWGVGTIIGGGFYALIGEVAGEAGLLTPLAFLVAALIAGFSALSFAELSARLPYSAGEAHYVLEAFGRRGLSALVGWLVITTGVVSAATLANAFARFARTLVELPSAALVIGVVVGLGVLAAWGIAESVVAAAIVTVIETCGLLLVIALAGDRLPNLPAMWSELSLDLSLASAGGVFLGAFIAFYSFVGFEDMVNLAEEVQRPAHTMPRGIVLSLAISTLIYVAVTLVVIAAVPQRQLIESHAPLSLAVHATSPAIAGGLTLVGMLAGLNGALVQVVMASRVAYGLARKGQAPALLARVHPITRTPLPATALASVLVMALALFFPLATLAKITSAVLLSIYALVNLSLFQLKRRPGWGAAPGPDYPSVVPAAGFLITLAFLLFQAATRLVG
ncbi:MAG: APC family permease [Myxococcales bacterium]|nr:APC family permease [Myxococcales bacterium]